ncbi:MAG: Lrp/AsnC family transcriptional regulator [Candidatus Andeanibacterium colombiense]|uniref:Lrp/AsnC family transcriptional regulator n=1 Tax=Candidatus Andeanibacterium colombiense TaxID=3121345 RepID=A0AAJ6BNY8_9SPHN|nr:MAG: Lrp/AsnC family transcriptional regulator [Sphingomonadaceae bacterium]
MDKIDWKILAELEMDGRLSFAELGERVALSKSPCWARVRELERSGVIRGYSAVVDPGAIGLAVHCLVSVRISFDKHAEFEQAVLDHPAIMECHTIAGDSDYMLRVHSRSVEHLDELLRNGLAKLPGVHRLSTIVCLKAIKPHSSLSKWAAIA